MAQNQHTSNNTTQRYHLRFSVAPSLLRRYPPPPAAFRFQACPMPSSAESLLEANNLPHCAIKHPGHICVNASGRLPHTYCSSLVFVIPTVFPLSVPAATIAIQESESPRELGLSSPPNPALSTLGDPLLK